MAKSNKSAMDESEESHQNPPWKSYLYQLQLQSPKPKRVICTNEIQDKPSYYGREFHGKISREEADSLLSNCDGCYVVRQSQRAMGAFTLSLRFNGVTKNYKLYYDGKHYVGEKRFDTIQDLVADGLITMYLESKAADYIALMCKQSNYEKSPYMTLSCRKRRQITTEEQRENTKNTQQNQINDTTDSSLKKIELQGNIVLNCADETLSEGLDVLHYEKSHVFKVHNFKGLQWCDLCGNFMWGLIAQGVKCEDCGFSGHKKCCEQIPPDCLPQLRYVKRMFGVDLTTLVKVHNTHIPIVIEMCVTEIEKRGLDHEGLYRVSGFNDSIEMAKMMLDSYGADADISKVAFEDINVICGVLKLFFRLLPIPLITFDTYPQFLTSAKKSDEEEKLNGICEAVNMLPPAHYQTLRYLIQHLSRVAEKHQKNLMTSANLSTVFCPTLMRTPDIIYSPESLVAWKYESWAIDALISHHKRLFDH
ncbi:N-chimaerin [Nymphon striatum]|nr:N-chimaerin [Nymphon striatum]KAG1682924.1 N-chimaerin [Nymphon striatum]